MRYSLRCIHLDMIWNGDLISQLSDGLYDDSYGKKLSSTPIPSPPIKRYRRKIQEDNDSLEGIKRFTKQRQALDELLKMEADKIEGRIFTEEDKEHGNGARKFIVTTVDKFWKEYSKWDKKHFYELIAEHQKCRLYFDLEYPIENNKDVESERCLNDFIDKCISLLDEMYSITVDRTKFLLLDSSTSHKFSIHIIVHLPNRQLFPSSSSILPFVQRLRTQLLVNPPSRIKNTDDKEIVICDCGVYTRNRNFRLYLSSKLDKNTPLIRSNLCQFYNSTPSDQQIFIDSLCVPIGWNDCSIVKTNGVINENIHPYSSIQKFSNVIDEGIHSSSPFPLLDEFILSVLSKWKSNESINKWKLEGDKDRPSSITYYPLMGRYCFNIGREHKSNGTYWRVNLINGTFTQRCFDIDCKGRSSNVFTIPSIIMEQINKRYEVSKKGKEEDIDVLDITIPSNEHIFTDWLTVFDS